MKLVRLIIRQGMSILILTSVISSLGGVGLEVIQEKLINLLPLLVLMPALNDLTGDFGCVISSKFTTMLFMGKVKTEEWWRSKDIRELLRTVLIIALVSAVYLTFISIIITNEFSFELITKMLIMASILTTTITTVIFLVSIIGGLIVYKKNLDPDNYLIPITTAVADLSSMLLFALMINLLFTW